jgi:hypothetical protein
MSKKHVVIEYLTNENCLIIKDLNSTNGSLRFIKPKEHYKLKNESIFKLGENIFKVVEI